MDTAGIPLGICFYNIGRPVFGTVIDQNDIEILVGAGKKLLQAGADIFFQLISSNHNSNLSHWRTSSGKKQELRQTLKTTKPG